MNQIDYLLNNASCCTVVVVVGLDQSALLCSDWGCYGSYLVDPASSHMLVSKIKPCMSKYKPNMVRLRMAH